MGCPGRKFPLHGNTVRTPPKKKGRTLKTTRVNDADAFRDVAWTSSVHDGNQSPSYSALFEFFEACRDIIESDLDDVRFEVA